MLPNSPPCKKQHWRRTDELHCTHIHKTLLFIAFTFSTPPPPFSPPPTLSLPTLTHSYKLFFHNQVRLRPEEHGHVLKCSPCRTEDRESSEGKRQPAKSLSSCYGLPLPLPLLLLSSISINPSNGGKDQVTFGGRA